MINVAVQLYSLRNYGTVEEILKAVSEAGYHVVETVGTHGLSKEDMKALLDKYQLEVCSSHVALSELRDNLAHQIEFNKFIDNDTLVIPYIAPEDRPASAEAWRALGASFAEIAKKAKAQGMHLLYHNHDFEMQVFEGKTALEHLYEGAGLSHLKLELDLAWVVKGAKDPLVFLSDYAANCPRVHVKDIAPAGENLDQDGWADVGHGIIDWTKILPAAKQAGAAYFIVEHDNPKDPVQTITRSFEYLKTQL